MSREERRASRASAQEVARDLRIRIQTGDLAPGEPLREAALAEQMVASRSTIREALRILEDDGLVETEKFRGARVSSPSAFQVFDQFEIRAALFGMAARYACFRASDEDIAEIVARIRQVVEIAPERPAQWRVEEGVGIGALISRHASPDAQKILAISYRKARWHLSVLGLDERGSVGPLDHWSALAVALTERNADAAAESARRIILHVQQDVTQAIVARGEAGVRA